MRKPDRTDRNSLLLWRILVIKRRLRQDFPQRRGNEHNEDDDKDSSNYARNVRASRENGLTNLFLVVMRPLSAAFPPGSDRAREKRGCSRGGLGWFWPTATPTTKTKPKKIRLSRERATKVRNLPQPGPNGRDVFGPRVIRASDRSLGLQTVETV